MEIADEALLLVLQNIVKCTDCTSCASCRNLAETLLLVLEDKNGKRNDLVAKLLDRGFNRNADLLDL